jgi:hypothetical protein
MTKDAERISRIITEKIGGCWHEADPHNFDECIKCHTAFQDRLEPIPVHNIDYTDPTRLCELIRWAREQKWWDDFLDRLWTKAWGSPVAGSAVYLLGIPVTYSDQPIFSKSLSEWLELMKHA